MKQSKTDGNYFRILKLQFINNERFQDAGEFVFDQQCTLIAGDNGTGKTALVNILAALDSNVEITGDRELMQKYKEVIIINGNNPDIDHQQFYTDDLTQSEMNKADINKSEINKATRSNFESILEEKPWKIEVYADMNPDEMALGEKMCFKYAYIFAVRKALNLDVPVIIDSPFGLLDNDLRLGLRGFLDKQTCQKILLATEAEFKDDKVQYNLKSLA